jgi:cytochrome c peroxidase
VSTATFTDVWRSVPSVLNVSVTGADPQASVWARGPNPQGGYQLDGRVDTLQNQARAAFLDHAKVATVPDAEVLDDIAAYETGLLANTEPPLDELETMGKAVFNRACSQCHNGRGMSTPLFNEAQQIRRFIDDYTACPAPLDTVSPPRWSLAPCSPALARNEQTYEISFADGFKTRRTSSDPGRALLSGFVVSGPLAADDSCLHSPCGSEFEDDWQKLDIAPLHGISKRAPYFHNNSAATLEDVVIHYEELFKRVDALSPSSLPGVPPLLTTDGVHRDRPNVPAERAALVAYLSKL